MKASVVFLGSYKMVDLYTVERLDEQGNPQLDEYNTFRDRMIANGGRDQRQVTEIDAILGEILSLRGAIDDSEFFRREGDFRFYAIPSHPLKHLFWDSDGKTHFGLRLYCLIVNEENLIVLNGCSKTHQNPNLCPDCSDIFKFCRAFCKEFCETWEAGKLIVKGRYISLTQIEEEDEDDGDDEIEQIILNISI